MAARKSREANDFGGVSEGAIPGYRRGSEQQAHRQKISKAHGYRPRHGGSRSAHRPEYRLRDRPIFILAVIPEWPGRDRKEDLQVRRYYPDPARAARI